ncbi:2,3-bisphosphoglycerate-independent phosphoglycerate mutase [Bacteriovoracaceae bacterium]|nr:2,3-bisphosphoglycerate-independent phosphoglycerate mutase [Bacteriovoracaceae bacterium]
MKNIKTISQFKPKCLMVILDGFGIREENLKNAIAAANPPTINSLFKNYPNTLVQSGGEFVGLPKGLAGNSEVGHLNLGSGRSIRQDLVRINESIKEETLQELPEFKKLLEKVRTKNKIHLMALLSDGGVHSHLDHLKYIIKLINQHIPKADIYLHGFMDGRDTPKNEGINYLKNILESDLNFTLASIQGRSIGMDRDQRWEKIRTAYEMMTDQKDQSISVDVNPLEYMQSQYDQNIFDEFILPTLFEKEGVIRTEEPIFFINFRPDRAKQISLAFTDPNFKHFSRDFLSPYFLCMTPYIQEEMPEVPILFDKEKIKLTLSEYLSKLGKKQFKIAETEKYAHVTYFFNGGEETPFKNEERKLVLSPKDVETYDLKPEMSAFIVTENLKDKIQSDEHDFYLVNYANADMVGHTGNFEAAVQAIEALDKCLQELIKVCTEKDIPILLTADHGNADQMVYEDGRTHTSHSTSPVPLILIHPELKNCVLELNQDIKNSQPALKDIAPTVLSIMGLEIPNEFTGKPVFK